MPTTITRVVAKGLCSGNHPLRRVVNHSRITWLRLALSLTCTVLPFGRGLVQTEAFGAFVKMGGFRKHGLVHCSQMANFRVEDVTDVCKVGDAVYVKVSIYNDPSPPSPT